MQLPGPPALPVIGNSLQFNTNDLCKLFQDVKEIPLSYGPISRLWLGPVLIVVLADPDNIESVIKQEKICSREYLLNKALENPFEMDCSTSMETNGEGIVKSYLQLFVSVSWKRL
jgi:hypothetical protein